MASKRARERISLGKEKGDSGLKKKLLEGFVCWTLYLACRLLQDQELCSSNYSFRGLWLV